MRVDSRLLMWAALGAFSLAWSLSYYVSGSLAGAPEFSDETASLLVVGLWACASALLAGAAMQQRAMFIRAGGSRSLHAALCGVAVVGLVWSLMSLACPQESAAKFDRVKWGSLVGLACPPGSDPG